MYQDNLTIFPQNRSAKGGSMTSKPIKIVAAALLACVLSGCIEHNMLVTVKKDGSGTVTQATFMNDAFVQQMAALGGDASAVAELPMDLDALAEQAQQMGEGVSFVKADRIKSTDGRGGVRAVFSFKDITKLKLAQQPAMPVPDQMQAANDADRITFGFKKGDVCLLTINMPQPEAGDAEAAAAPQVDPAMDMDLPPEQMMMMKQMFDGFRIRIIVKVDGEIVKTNAGYVDVSGGEKQKSVVTLLDMDLGKLLGDDAMLKKLAGTAQGPAPDMNEAKKLLKDVEGLKIETEKKVTVEFK
jgi:hypothetical protein